MSTAKKAMLKNSTPGQIKKIHALVSALKIDDDRYRDNLRDWHIFKLSN
jgi:hypothetical protein